MPTHRLRRPPAASATRGVSLIELLVGITILGIAVAIGAPAFTEWISNSQIRSTAESVQNGLQLARAEAVRRNTSVQFQLTTTLDNTCTTAAAGPNWVVSISSATTPVASHCGDDISDTSSSMLIQKGAPVTANASAKIAASQPAFGFNGLGRIVATTTPATSVVDAPTIDIQSTRGVCAVDPGGTLHCLRLLITPGGQIRMCDPGRPSGDAMACPKS